MAYIMLMFLFGLVLGLAAVVVHFMVAEPGKE